MTNYHLINDQYIYNNKEIRFSLNDDSVMKKIEIDDNRKIYSNKKYDTTIIEIRPEKDKLYNFLDIDEKIYIDESQNFYKNIQFI